MLAKHCLPKLTNTHALSEEKGLTAAPENPKTPSQHFPPGVYTCALGCWEHRACASAGSSAGSSRAIPELD